MEISRNTQYTEYSLAKLLRGKELSLCWILGLQEVNLEEPGAVITVDCPGLLAWQ